MDACEDAQASEVEAVYADADLSGEGIDAESSIRHETKLRAGNNYFDHPNLPNLKNHNMNEVPPKLHFQLGGKKELNKLLNAGILAAEILEENQQQPQHPQENHNETALDEESMNQGERLPGQRKKPEGNNANPQNIENSHSMHQKHSQNGPYSRPGYGPIRRYPAHMVERRPINHMKRPLGTFVIPQPAPLMNHYKPHAAPLMTRGQNNNGQNSHLKPVLVLGQPMDIKPHIPPPYYKGSQGRVPFPDHVPQGYIRRPERPFNSMLTAASNPHQTVKKIPVEHHGKGNKEPEVKFSAPINSHEVIPKDAIKPAENKGFLPQTVIVESGFRPINTNRKSGVRGEHRPERISEQRRRADIISEIDEAIEGDALLINSRYEEPIRSFEPMFIPSPRDDMAEIVPMKVETVQQQQKQLQMQMKLQHMQEHKHNNRPHEVNAEEMDDEEGAVENDEEVDDEKQNHDGVMQEQEHEQEQDDMEEDVEDESPNYPKISTRDASRKSSSTGDVEQMADMNFESGEDKMAEAASRMDAYYLPPDNKAMAENNDKYDMQIPEGAVVTYDGKAVLDTTLINSAPPDDVNELVLPGLTTKTEQLRNTPQFGPFKGEMPPLSLSAFVPPDNLPQLKPALNRYRSSVPVTEYSNPLTSLNTVVGASGPISTKLTLLKAGNRRRREVRHQEYIMGSGHDRILPSLSIVLIVLTVVGVIRRM